MSNVLLFVYPDRRYFEHEAKGLAFSTGSNKCLRYILPLYDQLIAGRYRERGFEVYWLVFSVPGNPDNPDIGNVSSTVTIADQDKVISAGITFGQTGLCIYADPEFIRSQLPDQLEKVVVVGFHEADCVDKIAEYMHLVAKADTMVDTDLTNLMPVRVSCGIPLPVHRTTFEPFDFIGSGASPMMIESLTSHWVEKPWTRPRRMHNVPSEEIQEVVELSVPVCNRDYTLGKWRKSKTGTYASLSTPDEQRTVAHVNVINDRFVAVSYHAVPPEAFTAEQVEEYTLVSDFDDFNAAASWLEELRKEALTTQKPQAETG